MLRDQQRHLKLGRGVGARALDVDDLLIMCLLLEGCGANSIAKYLVLTPPAVSHRFYKYRQAFGEDFFYRSKKKSLLSEKGLAIAHKAREAYCILLGADSNFSFESLFSK